MSLETVKSFQGWAVSLATNLSYFGADLDHGPDPVTLQTGDIDRFF